GLVKSVLKFLERLLCVVQHAVGTVSSLDRCLALLILRTVLLSILNHALNFSIGETGARSNGDGLVFAGRLVGGVNVDDGIRVNIESDFDLRDTTVGWRNSDKLEVSKK